MIGLLYDVRSWCARWKVIFVFTVPFSPLFQSFSCLMSRHLPGQGLLWRIVVIQIIVLTISWFLGACAYGHVRFFVVWTRCAETCRLPGNSFLYNTKHVYEVPLPWLLEGYLFPQAFFVNDLHKGNWLWIGRALLQWIQDFCSYGQNCEVVDFLECLRDLF